MAGRRSVGVAIRRVREAAGLSQDAAAARIGRSRRWWVDVENDRSSPRQRDLEAIAKLFGTTAGALIGQDAGTLRREVHDELAPAGLNLPPGEPANHEYVAAIHDTIRHLVALEVRHGGDDIAPLAQHYFETVRRRLAVGGHPPSLDRELTASAGELAEVAAWLLHDADDQEGARRLNVEALHLSRLSGDRSIELLTMSNMAFVALFNRQPGDALMLARAALADGRLTNRQRVIFRLREARALAQLGAGPTALRIAFEAVSDFEDGTTREDPEWSWWVDTSEVTGHLAWAYVEAGEPTSATPILQRSVETCPPGHANNHLFRLARFLSATVEAAAWPDAEEAAARLLPCATEVRSGRAVRLLRDAMARIESGPAPPRLVDAGRRLGEAIRAAQTG
jgi:transcriptional regulator with XRE-family HTH domain